MTVSLSIGHTPNYATLRLNGLTIHFSYETPIAFEAGGGDDFYESAVRVNDWGPTTGKHLNAIDGGSAEAKAARVGGAVFEARLGAYLAERGLA